MYICIIAIMNGDKAPFSGERMLTNFFCFFHKKIMVTKDCNRRYTILL